MPDAESAQASKRRWFPYNKGGTFRRWYGNRSHVVNWHNDGSDILSSGRAYPRSRSHYFQRSITYSATSSLGFGARHCGSGFLFDAKGSSCFAEGETHWAVLALLATKQVDFFLGCLNPTLEFQTGDIRRLPVAPRVLRDHRITDCAKRAADRSKGDWNAYERSWDFQSLPILTASSESTPTLESSYTAWIAQNRDTIAEMKRLEEENNRLFIDAYGLAEELTPEVPIEQITLTVNPAYRYGVKLTEEEQWNRFRQDTMKELISYAVGCMFGRYSIDKPGLVLADQGETFQNFLQHVPNPTFLPDEDNIIPILDDEYFTDDIVGRFKEFLKLSFSEETLSGNLDFISDAIGRTGQKSSEEVIRNYFLKNFFKDHCKTYKKRPIYWLFTSGKDNAFNALIYMHRYNRDTVGKIRVDYLHKLQGMIEGQLTTMQNLPNDPRERKKAEKKIAKLRKQMDEMRLYEEDLKHIAENPIEIDLDDGVKVNHAKFGNLLAKI
jgi:hypothetical protein